MAINDTDEIATINIIRKAQANWKRIFPVLTSNKGRHTT
jgi:hypothetical protein